METNDSKAKEIGSKWYYDGSNDVAYRAALQMAKWKDSQMDLLLDAIDHAYLKTDGTYGDLSLEVVDKVNYLKELRCKNLTI